MKRKLAAVIQYNIREDNQILRYTRLLHKIPVLIVYHGDLDAFVQYTDRQMLAFKQDVQK